MEGQDFGIQIQVRITTKTENVYKKKKKELDAGSKFMLAEEEQKAIRQTDKQTDRKACICVSCFWGGGSLCATCVIPTRPIYQSLPKSETVPN